MVTLDDLGRLSAQGGDDTGGMPPLDVVFGILTTAWVEMLGAKIRAGSRLIVPDS